MRVLLNATGYNPVLNPLNARRPTPLFRLVDKPIIVHIIEHLISLKVSSFDIVLNHLPEQIEECLEEGKRWGVSITYHLAGDHEKPFAPVIPAAFSWQEELILLGQADVLPDLQTVSIKEQGTPTLLFHGSRGWVGWGTLMTSDLKKLDKKTSYLELPEQLKGAVHLPISGVLFSVQTYQDWKLSNDSLLSSPEMRQLFPTTAKKLESEIWISRGVVLHPTAVLKPPLFIGEHCYIKESTELGPYTIVESECVIDKNSLVNHSLISRQSYVGEGLELLRCIVDQRTLINLEIGATVDITDAFILGPVSPPSFSQTLQKMMEQTSAFLLALLLAPFLGFYAWKRGVQTRQVVRLPVRESARAPTFSLLEPATPFQRKTFNRLFGLINIAKGEMHFVGLAPRSLEEFHSLPATTRQFVSSSKIGLLTLDEVEPEADRDTAEVFYATHQTLWGDIHLIWRWLLTFLK